jgi:hypothetical protein
MGSTIHVPVDLVDRTSGLLVRIAHIVDASRHDRGPHAAVSVELVDDEVVLGLRAFDRHPVEELAGLVAPSTWWAFLLCTTGRVRFLDQPERSPERIVNTFGRSREGEEVSLLRRRNEVATLRGPAEGSIPDLVRAILGVVP